MTELDEKYRCVGAVVGRFQIDDLHDGHKALLDHVRKKHSRMLILVGVRPTRANRTHPLSFETRRHMLNQHYPEAIVLPIMDHASDEAWSQKVDQTIEAAVGFSAPVMLYCGRDGFEPHYHGRHNVDIHHFTGDEHSSTEIRWQLQGKTLTTPDFRAGAIHAIMTQPSVTEVIADMAVFSHDGSGKTLLMIRKPNSHKWGLPGGFFDPKKDKNLRETATRETAEETGVLVEVSTWNYVDDFLMNDWRLRGVDGHYFHSTLFKTELPWGAHPVGMDDVADAKFLRIDCLPEIAPVHVPLFQKLGLI